jgi:hypothetical protein
VTGSAILEVRKDDILRDTHHSKGRAISTYYGNNLRASDIPTSTSTSLFFMLPHYHYKNVLALNEILHCITYREKVALTPPIGLNAGTPESWKCSANMVHSKLCIHPKIASLAHIERTGNSHSTRSNFMSHFDVFCHNLWYAPT